MGRFVRMFDGIVRHERVWHVNRRIAGYSHRCQAGSDQIAQHAPILSTLNPAQQVTNLFYDILYYDSFQPFLTTVGVLAAMSLVWLAVATVLLRRQRYEHL